MLERSAREGTVDIYNYLNYLRTRRINMVQTEVSKGIICIKYSKKDVGIITRNFYIERLTTKNTKI